MTRKLFRNIVNTGLVGILGLLPGCMAVPQTKPPVDPFLQREYKIESPESSNNPLGFLEFDDKPENFVPRNDKKAEPSDGAYFTGYASATYASNFIEDNLLMGSGPFLQSQIEIARNDNLTKGDKIAFRASGNYDINDGDFVENDFNFEATRQVYFWENLMKGYTQPNYGDFISLGYHFRDYPNGCLEEEDNNHILYASFLHSSRADLKFEWLHLFEDKDNESGELLRFTASKKVKLGDIYDGELYMDPFISTAYASNWHEINDFTAVTSGINISHEKNQRIITGKIQSQSSLNKNVEDVLYAGIELGFKF